MNRENALKMRMPTKEQILLKLEEDRKSRSGQVDESEPIIVNHEPHTTPSVSGDLEVNRKPKRNRVSGVKILW